MKKATFTSDQVRLLFNLSPEMRDSCLDTCDRLVQMTADELNNNVPSADDPELIRTMHAKCVKRAEAARRRKERRAKQLAEAAAKPKEAPKQDEKSPNGHYDLETLHCPATVASIFNNGMSFRQQSLKLIDDIEKKFTSQIEPMIRCVLKLIKHTVHQAAPFERRGVFQLIHHRLHAAIAHGIDHTLPACIPFHQTSYHFGPEALTTK